LALLAPAAAAGAAAGAAESPVLEAVPVLEAPAESPGAASLALVLVRLVPLSAAGAPPELRKSVTYQPVPFNWNPAAVTILEKVAWPQLGQSVSAGSDTLRRYSFWNPQFVHLYS
jgi:hypothetical protein